MSHPTKHGNTKTLTNDPRCKHTADAILNTLLAEVIYVLLLLWNELAMYSQCQGEWFIFILGYFSQP